MRFPSDVSGEYSPPVEGHVVTHGERPSIDRFRSGGCPGSRVKLYATEISAHFGFHLALDLLTHLASG